MLVIRNVFVAKPGKASQMAELMKEVMSSRPGPKVRVLTDYVGKFNTVVMEFEVNEMAEYEKQYKQYLSDPEMKEKMKGYADMYQEGYREVLHII